MSDVDPEREHRLAQRAVEAGIVEERAKKWAAHYRGFLDVHRANGNFALAGIVREYDETRDRFLEFCRRRLDWAMVDGMRVEGRHQRNDRAALLAAADLLALYRADPHAAPLERLASLGEAVAATGFAAMTAQAQRDAEADMVAREDYAIAHDVMKAVLEALPSPQRKLMVLRYSEDMRLTEAQTQLDISYSTVERWHKLVLAEIRKQLAKRSITHAPERGGAPRVALAVLRGGKEEEP